MCICGYMCKLYFLGKTFSTKYVTKQKKKQNPDVQINRGSNMSTHVLLNILNELMKSNTMLGLPSILSLFRNEFNIFNNIRACMFDSIYHRT